MTLPRSSLVCVDDTPFYHITSRCVRRSFLCGVDPTTGTDYSHRRLFIEQRIHLLSSVFAIDIAAYAVMSNHLHLVVKLSPQVVDEWSDHEVVNRWTCLFKGPLLIQKYSQGVILLVLFLVLFGPCFVRPSLYPFTPAKTLASNQLFFKLAAPSPITL